MLLEEKLRIGVVFSLEWTFYLKVVPILSFLASLGFNEMFSLKSLSGCNFLYNGRGESLQQIAEERGIRGETFHVSVSIVFRCK